MTPDHLIRQRALDTMQSFIVQAPAGSGKTELLVQRFLALLAQSVRVPEDIIAITFTRKAAAEMRHRILSALQLAQGAAPDTPHGYKTWELGRAVLARDSQSGWHLLENPNRLRIQTIDALCASITRQAPLLSGLGISRPALERDIAEYYRMAVHQLFAVLEENSPLSAHLAVLLLHLDNRMEKVEGLLVGMLMRRDQWLPHLISHGHALSTEAFRQVLESGLYHVRAEMLAQCAEALPEACLSEVWCLLCFAAGNLGDKKGVFTETAMPAATVENDAVWVFLANTLLTQEGAWRQRVDKRQGFPAEEKAMKQRIGALLDLLRENDLLRQHLAELCLAPPIHYTESQWQILHALSAVLPRLVAELKVLFSSKNVADFSEVAMAASAALGDAENPSDLSFILEAKMRHILVDEFQDTSMTQFHLLEKLTAGWQPQDGHSLFLVGDPMQSIYRFRQAEVGLFLKAQQEGIGDLPLVSLVLEANFRAAPDLVHWINQTFQTIFPQQSDIPAGAIPFSPCQATKPADPHSGVFVEAFWEHEHAPVAKIIEIIQQAASNHLQEKIAILVRSRSHLKAILPALKKENIPFHAVEIEPLYTQPIVQDLLSLTGALLHLGDAVHWWSVLRAPWCGLTLHDLHAIAQKKGKKLVWDALSAWQEIAVLSEDGKKRLAAVVPILKQGLAQRGRLPLRTWVEETWHALQGPLCMHDPAAYASAEAYFALLSTFDAAGEMPDILRIAEILQKQYATPELSTESNVHIMTIHKAKGLEFDIVVIPFLELKNRGESEQLLLWLDRPRAHAGNDLLLAPVKAKHQKADPVYDWLRGVEKTKTQHELTRLLYVAATRAKKKLHLIARLSMKDGVCKKPETGSFLELLWKPFEKMAENISEKTSVCADAISLPSATLQRLKIEKMRRFTAAEERIVLNANSLPSVGLDPTARHMGTVIHRVLEQISQEGVSLWTAQKIAQEKIRWRRWYIEIGFPYAALESGIERVQAVIQTVLQDPRGQWILQAHTAHHSEYALTAPIFSNAAENTQDYVIDRTFIDENETRWIIDYKTSSPGPDQAVADFLEKAQATHRAQLETYAAMMHAIEKRPICLGLYFPLFGGWRAWDFVVH
jgi:ATP-dependent helicase/nuclease subunit A